MPKKARLSPQYTERTFGKYVGSDFNRMTVERLHQILALAKLVQESAAKLFAIVPDEAYKTAAVSATFSQCPRGPMISDFINRVEYIAFSGEKAIFPLLLGYGTPDRVDYSDVSLTCDDYGVQLSIGGLCYSFASVSALFYRGTIVVDMGRNGKVYPDGTKLIVATPYGTFEESIPIHGIPADDRLAFLSDLAAMLEADMDVQISN
jgi:hypothetical protein